MISKFEFSKDIIDKVCDTEIKHSVKLIDL